MELAANFKIPYPQDALGGEFGLTSIDIANALGVLPGKVHEKLRRSSFVKWCKIAELQAIPFEIANETTGLSKTIWAFSIEAAKAFIVKWDNRLGWEYLKYLLTCEKIVEQKVPTLLAEIKALRSENEALKVPVQKQLPGRGIVSVIKRTYQMTDLFGEVHTEVIREKKPYSDLSRGEMRQYRLQQSAATMRGISARIDKSINDPEDLN